MITQIEKPTTLTSEMDEPSSSKSTSTTMVDASPIATIPLSNEPSSLSPKIGMTFRSEEEAYEFYNAYAKRLGFSIRKYHVRRRKDESLKRRKFVCSNEGTRAVHKTHITKKPRPIERTNCKAQVEFKIDRNNIWTLLKFEVNHNHPLASPDKVHMLRSHRKFLPIHKQLIDQLGRAGIKPAEIYNFFEARTNKLGEVGCMRMDSNNYVRGPRTKFLKANEIQFLLQYLKGKQVEDSSFFYAIQVHETGQVTNIFWADGQAIMDYAYFGDVVCFDTAFQANQYEIPFAPFLGMNHHKQTVIFGGALLFDDTTESFIWLFETFMTVMRRKQPITIFTDQSSAISKAIELVLPNTCYGLCLWHIFQDAASNLSQIIHSSPNFLPDFRSCIYECCAVEKFMEKWNNLITTYSLSENTWMTNFLNLREKWAAVYHRDSFCADMTTTQRSENMHNDFKKFFQRNLSPLEFIDQYHKAIKLFREKEFHEDLKSRQTKLVGVAKNTPMLKVAAESYTRVIYNEFEEEFMNQLSCFYEILSSDGTIFTYKVSQIGHGQEGVVIFNSQDLLVQCSCKKFESEGILCMHALKVLIHNNVLTLPPHYILKRWTKYAKHGVGSNTLKAIDGSGRETLSSLYSRVCQKAFTLSIKSANSREALENLEKGLDKLTLKVEEILHNVSFEGRESDSLLSGSELVQDSADRLPKL